MPFIQDLVGCVVLVVEDEYYIATDTAEELSRAGAVILGPCCTASAARRMLEEFQPSHAVIDLNLDGLGPRFDIARELKIRNVQTVFLAGYDRHVAPADFADAAFIQKPATCGEVVAALDLLPHLAPRRRAI